MDKLNLKDYTFQNVIDFVTMSTAGNATEEYNPAGIISTKTVSAT